MDLLYVEMCVESFFKGVVRLVLDAWCGYGEFLFNLQPCGYLWRGMKSQCMVRLLQYMVRLPPLFFLNGFPHVPEWCRCTLSSSEEMTLLFIKGTAASVLVFQWCGYTLHSSTDRKNQLLSDYLSLFFFLGAVVDLLFSSPATVMEDTVGKLPLSLILFLSS